ncbi:2-amino-4-hydroxy-6-hydroxymethyldihydropteridine diphosphokinase [Sphingomonas sp.]|uniref:2-amino-4-hydroxy-6- hydroxymethyldihydropteridine diphosphokinase n=1 Tax=Sphingomonas sp. TaxID=28214 RepID=UPI003B3ABB54
MHRYAIGLGSNRPHGRHGGPRRVLVATVGALAGAGIRIVAQSRVLDTAPLGPSIRRFANAAAIVETPLEPLALLALLKRIETDFGRRRGRRWGARVIDLDILLWDGGRFQKPALTIPHRGLACRRFVLDPLIGIAPTWRIGACTVAQARARLTRRRPIHRGASRSGP